MLLIYLVLIIFVVSVTCYIILTLIGISSEFTDPTYTPNTLYGDCPCCDSPIRIQMNGDMDNSSYVYYKCTRCDWNIRYEKDDKNGWRRVG